MPFPPEPTMTSWGNPDGKGLFFLHANSYSAHMYRDFLQPLSKEFNILSPDLPGHGQSSWNGRIEAWVDLADYYITQIEKTPPKQPMVAMGHSIGAIVIMLIAIKRPNWFEKIVFLDPVMLPKRILGIMRGLRLISLMHLIPIARSAGRRKRQFENKAAALGHYSKKKIFSRWAPGYLETYIDTCLKEGYDGTLQLCCSPELESSIYQSIPLNVWSLPRKLPIQSLFVIGDYSDTLNQAGFNRLKRSRGNHIVKSIAAGHLFPFEKPNESMAIIEEYLTL